MKLIRTVSTRRLLAVLAGLIAVIAAGAAIAVAAQGPGPTPKPASLATALHRGLSATAPAGITAEITFTNSLIGAANFTGGASDPILQGATGRLWLADGRMRLELQSSNGDTQIVVDRRSFWVSDPSANTVYEGTLPADGTRTSTPAAKDAPIPSVAMIQSELTKLAAHVTTSGATPTDVAGQAAYSVSVLPKHDGGLLGSAELAWDAARGIPLDFAVYARGSATPVLELKATSISYGPVTASDLSVTPPPGSKVVKVSTSPSSAGAKKAGAGHHAKVSGVAAVAARVPFRFTPPGTLDGLPRENVSLLDWGGTPAALVTYGQGLGGIAVIEQSAAGKSAAGKSAAGKSAAGKSAAGSGAPAGAPSTLSLPTVSIKGATGQELDTALGTVVRFTRGGVAYTLLGSVPPTAAELAARALTAG